MKNFLISLMLFVVPLVSMAQNENVNNGVLIPLQCDIVNGSIKNRPIKRTPPLFPPIIIYGNVLWFDQYYVGAEYELYCDGELISSGEVLKDEPLDCSCYPIGHYYVRILINQYLLCGEFDV